MEEKQYYVYILASKKYGTLYTGITSNLVQRIWQHKEGLAEGFTKKYNVHHLVYYEIHSESSKTIPSGLIWVSDYFDGWLPACAGMTGFFVMYRV